MQEFKTLQQQEAFVIEGPQLEILGEVESKLPAPAKKRSSAAVFAAAMALVAVFGIGGAKLKGAQNEVRALYTASDRYGNSIVTDLDMAADYAANVIRVGGQVLGTDDSAVQAAQAALDQWNATDSSHPARQFDAYSELGATVKLLCDAVPESDAKYGDVYNQYAQFASQQQILQREVVNYNNAAREYNRKVGVFPAVLVRTLWGAGEVELFA